VLERRIVPAGPGVFTLSLDLELAWGSWQRGSFAMDTFAGDSRMARRIDRRCRELRLPATWAVVGAWFDLAEQELQDVPPETSVAALRPGLGPYADPLPTVGQVLAAPDAFLDPELVQELSTSTAGHELGTHTYFHANPTTESGLVADVTACRAATPSRSPVRTIVYPRDAVRHVSALPAAQIDQYRTPGAARYFQKTGRPVGWGRAAHTLDQFLGRPAPLIDVQPGAVVAVPSSGVLTLRYGLRRRIPIRSLRRRYVRPLERAARTGGVYHLWTHPWNLALPGSDAFELLGDVLGRAAELRDRGDIEVLTIGGLADWARRGATRE
jgi:peptidoglycan/xylan/chitin deacetylase (PgdA/CDA1 family)